MTTAEAASKIACSISTVPRSMGTDERLGSQAGKRIAKQPAEIRMIRINALDHLGFFRWVGKGSDIKGVPKLFLRALQGWRGDHAFGDVFFRLWRSTAPSDWPKPR